MPTVPTHPNVLWKLTRPAPAVWQLAFDSPPDNRLGPDLLSELMGHLDTVEGEWRLANAGKVPTDPTRIGGALILTSANPKFWSNGLDPTKLLSPDFRNSVFDPFKARFITFPLITIAAVHGHCFAGGVLLALLCDYRLVTSGKGLWSLNEVDVGLPITMASAVVLRAKLSPLAIRESVIGKRFVQKDLLRLGFVDEIVDDGGDRAKLLERAVELAKVEGQRAKGGSLGSIKDAIYIDVLMASHYRRTSYYPDAEDRAFWDRVGRGQTEAKARSRL